MPPGITYLLAASITRHSASSASASATAAAAASASVRSTTFSTLPPRMYTSARCSPSAFTTIPFRIAMRPSGAPTPEPVPPASASASHEAPSSAAAMPGCVSVTARASASASAAAARIDRAMDAILPRQGIDG